MLIKHSAGIFHGLNGNSLLAKLCERKYSIIRDKETFIQFNVNIILRLHKSYTFLLISKN